jgi:hypothetical protein
MASNDDHEGAVIEIGPIPCNFFIVQTWRDEVGPIEFGTNNFLDAMGCLDSAMKDCTVGELFKVKIWNTLTYSLIFASEEKIREQSDKVQLFENGRSGYAENEEHEQGCQWTVALKPVDGHE